MCEFCSSNPCQCDRDDNNLVDMTADDWSEFYARNREYDMDHDHSMDY
jgi:hypothetical protein